MKPSGLPLLTLAIVAALLLPPRGYAETVPEQQTAANAEELRLKQDLDQAVREHGFSSQQAETARNTLIKHYRKLYRPAEALPYLREKFDALIRRQGEESEEATSARIELGSMLASLNYPAEALSHLELALSAVRKQHGDNHPQVATVLVNMALAYVTLGRLDEATDVLRKAVDIRTRALGRNNPQTAVAKFRLGQAYSWAGRSAEAEQLLKDAVDTLGRRKGEENRQYNLALSALGDLYRATGRLTEAEEAQQRALAEQIRNIGIQHPSTLYIMESLATTLYVQRRLDEAEKVTLQGLENSRKVLGAESHRTLTLAVLLARIQSARGDLAGAESALREVAAARVKVFGADSVPVAHTRVWLGETLHGARKFREAEREFRLAMTVLEKKLAPDHPSIANLHRNLGRLYLASGQPKLAVQSLSKAKAVYIEHYGVEYPFTIRLLSDLGQAYERLGDLRGAVEAYRTAMRGAAGFLSHRKTESPAARAQQEQSLRSALGSYLGLTVRAYHTQAAIGVDPLDESFVIAENLRSRSLQQAVLGMSARAAARDPGLADLVRKEQDLRLGLGAVEGEITSGLGSGQALEERDLTKTLVGKRRELERTLKDLGEEIRSRFPDYGRLINPEAASIAATRALLKPEETLLAYLVQSERTLLWVVRHDSASLRVIGIGKDELEKKVQQLRRSLDVNVSSLRDIPPFSVALANELYKLLVEPAAPVLSDSRHLVIVPHGPLLSLPFAALVARGEARPGIEGIPFSEYRSLPWLAATHAISIMPSATALVTIRKYARPVAAKQSFIGFGDPQFDPAAKPGDGPEIIQRSLKDSRELRTLPPLPETAEELKSIAAALGANPATSVVLGAQASKVTVKQTALDQFRVVAFATHGLVAGDLEGLGEPALALSAPEKPERDNDGLLTMSEVLGLKMNADWVVLSACNTAASDGSLKGEGLTGLAQAFFYAGARALLVSLWAVETTSTQQLTTSLFKTTRENPNLTRAQALASARKRMIEGPGLTRGGKEMFSYAHPFFWAAFVLVGEGGKD